MRFGISVVEFAPEGGAARIGPALAAQAKRAEAAGFDSFWVMDHFFQIPPFGPVEDPMLEAYALLAFAAAVTSRIKLGALVTGVTYRHPGVLVKTVTTLDVLSGGRAWLGIGAAWNEREHLGLGVPFPPLAERFARLEEALQIAKQMWAGEVKPYEGKHYRLAETLCSPQPLTKPHPPILIGGGGERKTLRLVAQYADACNLGAWSGELDELRHKLEVLRGHCEAAGRPYEAIEKTVAGMPVTRTGGRKDIGSMAELLNDPTLSWRDVSMSPAQAVDLLGRLAEMGVDHYICAVPVEDQEIVEVIATEVMPQLDRAPVAAD